MIPVCPILSHNCYAKSFSYYCGIKSKLATSAMARKKNKKPNKSSKQNAPPVYPHCKKSSRDLVTDVNLTHM